MGKSVFSMGKSIKKRKAEAFLKTSPMKTRKYVKLMKRTF